MDNAPKLFKTRRLPKQEKGGVPVMLRRSLANLVLAVCESFLNLRVVINNNDGTQAEADIKQTEMGTIITIPAPAAGGSNNFSVYMKACLEDGTECYVPVLVSGAIYRNPTTTPTVPPIDTGTVPGGSNQLT